MSQSAIQLGQTVTHFLTGFTGVVVGKAKYLTGCEQACVQPQGLTESGETKKAQWFDEDGLIPGEQDIITLPRRTADGCDVAPPSMD